jgi:hypothetical protein
MRAGQNLCRVSLNLFLTVRGKGMVFRKWAKKQTAGAKAHPFLSADCGPTEVGPLLQSKSAIESFSSLFSRLICHHLLPQDRDKCVPFQLIRRNGHIFPLKRLDSFHLQQCALLQRTLPHTPLPYCLMKRRSQPFAVFLGPVGFVGFVLKLRNFQLFHIFSAA